MAKKQKEENQKEENTAKKENYLEREGILKEDARNIHFRFAYETKQSKSTFK